MPIQLIFALLLALGLAFFLSEVCRAVRIPRVIGQVGAGIFLGIPVIKAQLFTGDSLDVLALLAEIGMVLLFFFVGLEVNFREFRRNFRESAFISVFNTALPLVIGFFAMQLLGFGMLTSVIIGISLAVSAQSVSVDMLEELKLLKSRIGGLILTAGAVDDVFELLLVSGILTLIHASFVHIGLMQVLANAGLFVLVLFAFRYYVIPRLLAPFESEHSSTSFFSGALVISLLMATISDLLGLGLLVGALSSGVVLRQTLLSGKTRKVWEERDIANAVHIVSFGFLVPVFFIWIGLSTSISSILENAQLTLLLIAIAFIGTIGGTILGVLASGGTLYEGSIVGWGVNPKGDVELVIASLALKNSLISQDIFTSIIVMAMATTLISPIVFKMLLERHKASSGKVK